MGLLIPLFFIGAILSLLIKIYNNVDYVRTRNNSFIETVKFGELIMIVSPIFIKDTEAENKIPELKEINTRIQHCLIFFYSLILLTIIILQFY